MRLKNRGIFADNSPADDEGVALVSVLWVLLLLALSATAFSAESRISIRAARNLVEGAIASAAADAGVQRALMDLSNLTPKGQAQYRWRFGDCSVVITIRDEATKLNLNTASDAEIIDLLLSVGVKPKAATSLADAIADFVDADDFPRANGAEQADYQTLGLRWGPKNAPIEVVEELHQVPGMTPDIYRKIALLVTTYSVTSAQPETPSGVIAVSTARSSLRGVTFFIRSEARRPSGARFVREVITQTKSGLDPWILSWRRRS